MELEVIQEQVAAANTEHEAILAENDSLRAEKRLYSGSGLRRRYGLTQYTDQAEKKAYRGCTAAQGCGEGTG